MKRTFRGLRGAAINGAASRPAPDSRKLRLDNCGRFMQIIVYPANGTSEEYRAIAPHVSADGVRVDGAVVALLPENSEQVSAAVAELLARERPAKAKPALSL